MALYNSAIYLGRALSFAALFAVSDTAVSGITGVTHVRTLALPLPQTGTA